MIRVCIRRIVINFTTIFECRKSECVTLLFWLVRFEKFIQVSSQVRITLLNHTESCYIHWINGIGLFRSDYGNFGKLCVSFGQRRCFCCIS